ncbi:MAG: bifunctional UDP-sugar hydrolase/5'-nucleotidase [Bdellovibrionota bacterium]
MKTPWLALHRIFLCLALTFLVLGVNSCPESAELVEVTILHTNDVHSHLRAEPSHSEKNPYGLGGLARMKTLIDQIRGQRKNAILLDAGDWSEGVMYYAVDAGSNMLKIFDAMGYNAVVAGNHDFLNGPSQLASTIERANPSFPVLGANKNLSKVWDREKVSRLVKEYTIIDTGEVRIGVIGLLTADPEYYEYFKPGVITTPVDAATRIAKKMREENLADVIVLLSHNKFENHLHWARQVPWVNVIVSGHSHHKTVRPIEVSNAGQPVYLAETGQWGQFLGDFQLIVDKKSKQVRLKNYNLHPVRSELAESLAIKTLVEKQDQELKAKFGRDATKDVIGHCDDELPHDEVRETPLANLSADAYRTATSSDMALESGMLTGVGLQPGPVTFMDAFNIAPHIYGPIPGSNNPFPQFGQTWTLKRLRLSGAQIRALVGIPMLARATGLPLGTIALSGARVAYKTKDAGMTPIQSIELYDEATSSYQSIDEQETYTLAIHDGLLLILKNLVNRLNLPIDLTRLEETRVQTWQALVDFIAAQARISAPNFEAGIRYRPLDADFGLYEHDVRVIKDEGGRGHLIQVTIRNEGLKPLPANLKLQALRGGPDDAVNDGTPGNEKHAVGPEVAVPALAPGARASLVIPWNDNPKSGVYALRVRLKGNDAVESNNEVVVHPKIR